MKTMDQWYAEWNELMSTYPSGVKPTPELVELYREMMARADAIHDWMHGFGPEPPEQWRPTNPATPEQTEFFRKWHEEHPWGESNLEIRIVEKGAKDGG